MLILYNKFDMYLFIIREQQMNLVTEMSRTFVTF